MFSNLKLYTYTVTLTVMNTTGCSDTASGTIIVFDEYSIVMPNVFTPNGDRINDLFMAKITGVKSLTGTIYDRWGLTVFEWKAVNQGWDGHYSSGQMANEGTYFYVITLTDESGTEHEEHGSFMLMR